MSLPESVVQRSGASVGVHLIPVHPASVGQLQDTSSSPAKVEEVTSAQDTFRVSQRRVLRSPLINGIFLNLNKYCDDCDCFKRFFEKKKQRKMRLAKKVKFNTKIMNY